MDYWAAHGLGGHVLFADAMPMGRAASRASDLSEAAQVEYCVSSLTELHRRLRCELVVLGCDMLR
jgi:hypothetical protein